jgi:hypothetical protein
MSPDEQAILLQAAAPAKPAAGQPCNGCGVCCAAELCPMGRLLFLRARGPCPALTWEDARQRYTCALVTAADERIHWLPRALRKPAGRFFARAIDAGAGCDADIQVL